jgi:hypothetical protein
MSRHAQDNLISVMLIAVFGLVIYLCQDFGPRARLIPLPLAAFGIVLTLAQLAWHNFGRDDAPPIEMISVDTSAITANAEGQPRTERTEEQLGQWGEAGAYLIVALLVGMIFAVGIFPTVFIFTAAYLILTRYCTVVRGLVYSAALTVSVYLLFVVALEMQPYHGLLAAWLS